MLPSWVKEEDDKAIFTGKGEVIYYVPKKYFDKKVASIIGEKVECLGIFQYCYFDETGKKGKLKWFKFPTIIECIPSSISNQVFQLDGTNEETEYRLLHFSEGSELLSSVYTTKSALNVEAFLKMLDSASLAPGIPYEEIYEYMVLNAQYNNFSYKVSHQILGLVISELCRDPDDISKPFRLSKYTDSKSYKMIGIKNVPKYTSSFTALTSEDPDAAIASTIINKGTGTSPLERVLMN